jgi:hypothetical protein
MVQYAEDPDPVGAGKHPALGTLGVQNWILRHQPPRKLIITIAEADEPVNTAY